MTGMSWPKWRRRYEERLWDGKEHVEYDGNDDSFGKSVETRVRSAVSLTTGP